MERTTIKQLFRNKDLKDGERVKIAGWLRTVRASNKIAFASVNDGSFFTSVQVVLESDKLKNYDEISSLNVGSAVWFEGEIRLTPNAQQPFEINADTAVIEGKSTPDYPLQKKRHSNEFLRSIAHLRPRTNTFSAVFRTRGILAYAIHKFFREEGFTYIHTPIITASDCEGAGEMFKITTLDIENPPKNPDGTVDYTQDFFQKAANLTVSGQLEAETHALALGSVYTFGPTFRAEKSNTPRHGAEFWMIEPEIAFADLKENMDISERMIKYIVKYVLDNAPEEMEFFNKFIDNTLLERLNKIVESDFARITYTEAIDILLKSNEKFDYPVSWGIDLQTEHERYITEKVFNKPVFVTDYPKEIKAFYMRMNDDNKTVAAMDLLVPGVGEIIGGSQREERLDMLLKRMKELGLSEKDYWWYLDLRRYGSVRHSGYGLGFERALMYITGIGNIRDVMSFPRTTGSAEF